MKQPRLDFTPPPQARKEALQLLMRAQRIEAAAGPRPRPQTLEKAVALRKQADALLNEARRIGRW